MKTIALTPGRRLGSAGRQVSSAGLWSGGYFHQAPVPAHGANFTGRLNCRVRASMAAASAGAENQRDCR
jgi:hypothetical protein